MTTKDGRFKTFHAPSKDKATQRALRHARKGQRIYVITDKQFGMARNSWDGTTPDVGMNPLVVRFGDNGITAFPLTSEQIQNPVIK